MNSISITICGHPLNFDYEILNRLVKYFCKNFLYFFMNNDMYLKNPTINETFIYSKIWFFLSVKPMKSSFAQTNINFFYKKKHS